MLMSSLRFIMPGYAGIHSDVNRPWCKRGFVLNNYFGYKLNIYTVLQLPDYGIDLLLDIRLLFLVNSFLF